MNIHPIPEDFVDATRANLGGLVNGGAWDAGNEQITRGYQTRAPQMTIGSAWYGLAESSIASLEVAY